MNYECEYCGDVFKEEQAHWISDVVDDWDDKDYIVCPTCHSSDIIETLLPLSTIFEESNND